jgi:para-nitrobenzyl esterase
MRGSPPARNWQITGQSGTAMRFEPGSIRPFDAWAQYQCDFWRSAYPAYFAARQISSRYPPNSGS